MECKICHIQYIGKSETEFNIRLNNHRKGVNRQNAPQADQHFKHGCVAEFADTYMVFTLS